MKAFVPAYSWERPSDLPQALQKLTQSGGKLRPFAGGTDLMVLFEAGKLPEGAYLDLSPLKELRGIQLEPAHLTIGALTTYRDLQKHSAVAKDFPLLVHAARETGALAIQNRGTIGGNIANASPAADTPPALLVYGAELELSSTQGARWVPYETFHTAYKKTLLKPDELITRIRVKRPDPGVRQIYQKVGTRRAQAISKVCFVCLYSLDAQKRFKDFRLGLGSVAPVPVRASLTEKFLIGRPMDRATLEEAAHNSLILDAAPISDIRSTREYRMRVAQNLLKSLESLPHVELGR